MLPLDMAYSDKLTLRLARALDRAWARYYSPGRVTVLPDIARPALASHLVQMANDGVAEESKLAEGGVLYLNSLAPRDRDQ